MRSLFVFLAACGRIGFDYPGTGDREYGDIGAPCLVDDNCSTCLRCSADLTCEAEPITDVFAGHRITCFLGAGGSRWCVGEGDGYPQPPNDRRVPRRSIGEDGWTRLGLGWLSHVGVRGGQTYEWNDRGEALLEPTGNWDEIANDMDGHCFLAGGVLECASAIVPGTWMTVSTGAAHTCGIQGDGSLWCWGLNHANELGQGVQPEESRIMDPTRVGTDTDWIDVGTGERLTCAMKADRSIWCWGMAMFTGTNMVDTLGVPTLVSSGVPWLEVEVNWNRACAGLADGHVWCWGGDGYGFQIFPGMDIVPVPTDLGIVVDEFVMGGHHTCARMNGRWSCWGWNAAGQLTNGDTETHHYPGVPLCSRE